ncbi:camp-regulated phosphoprotein/endosulfine conserved region-domain-containing protein [Cokeromyces recurvatus]|uniref:camp-regulated phosphoprotein/endosulfine conserved region-domain-containing protein n=1 Tax=Cokeromyces recurvatus TaxID=90255 RepID=UPI0022205512|nr:camp-regulated phosphoprotein/endosulfine conserved region-domain-containing protein [Cokeromyces recurvatus]KAI7897793.1 camp-regulated phosphoprotein/endosulfine conserved region-domain-containing protein [Cokeromyces recurvatus]
MNPSQANKVDISKLSEEEKKLLRMYGKLPDRKDLLGHKLKERKYFDSGDYALSKAGKEPVAIGSEHPSPDTIPHSNPTSQPGASPVKESPLVTESDKEANKQ